MLREFVTENISLIMDSLFYGSFIILIVMLLNLVWGVTKRKNTLLVLSKGDLDFVRRVYEHKGYKVYTPKTFVGKLFLLTRVSSVYVGRNWMFCFYTYILVYLSKAYQLNLFYELNAEQIQVLKLGNTMLRKQIKIERL